MGPTLVVPHCFSKSPCSFPFTRHSQCDYTIVLLFKKNKYSDWKRYIGSFIKQRFHSFPQKCVVPFQQMNKLTRQGSNKLEYEKTYCLFRMDRLWLICTESFSAYTLFERIPPDGSHDQTQRSSPPLSLPREPNLKNTKKNKKTGYVGLDTLSPTCNKYTRSRLQRVWIQRAPRYYKQIIYCTTSAVSDYNVKKFSYNEHLATTSTICASNCSL